MINIAVSSVAALCGKHQFKCQRDAIQELLRKQYKCATNPNGKMKKVKRDLFNSSFYKWYCRSTNVTSKMRIIARSLIVKTCKKHEQKFNRPFSYFCKERGLFREKLNTDAAEMILKTEIFGRQKKIEKKYDRFKIIGAIDGETDTHIIEIKTRSSPITECPEWERIQLAWYVYILQKPGYIFSFHNGSHNKFEITLERAEEITAETVDIINSIDSLFVNQ